MVDIDVEVAHLGAHVPQIVEIITPARRGETTPNALQPKVVFTQKDADVKKQYSIRSATKNAQHTFNFMIYMCPNS